MRKTAAALIVLAVASTATVARADDKKICTDAYIAAQTLRDEHHLLAARDKLQICARSRCSSFMRGQMVNDCTTWLAQVEAALPSIVFAVKDGSGNDLSAVHLTMDGQPLTDKLDGSAIPIDPGEHHFVFEAADLPKSEKTILVREAEKDRRERIVLGAKSTDVAGGAPSSSDTPATDGTSGTPTAAYVAFGAAGVGLVVGVVFTVLAVGEKGKCTQNACQPGVDPSANSNAVTLDTVVAGASYGVAALGAGLGLLFLSSTHSQATSTLTPALGPGWAGLQGTF